MRCLVCAYPMSLSDCNYCSTTVFHETNCGFVAWLQTLIVSFDPTFVRCGMMEQLRWSTFGGKPRQLVLTKGAKNEHEF